MESTNGGVSLIVKGLSKGPWAATAVLRTVDVIPLVVVVCGTMKGLFGA